MLRFLAANGVSRMIFCDIGCSQVLKWPIVIPSHAAVICAHLKVILSHTTVTLTHLKHMISEEK